MAYSYIVEMAVAGCWVLQGQGFAHWCCRNRKNLKANRFHPETFSCSCDHSRSKQLDLRTRLLKFQLTEEFLQWQDLLDGSKPMAPFEWGDETVEHPWGKRATRVLTCLDPFPISSFHGISRDSAKCQGFLHIALRRFCYISIE